MPVSTEENQITPRNANAREAAKTPRQKREDVAYTVNHTLICGTKDMIDPFITDWVQRKLGYKLSSSDGRKPGLKGNLKEWFVGEAAGDVGAVPVTIALQRFAPGIMESIGENLESAFGSHFRKGAERAAKHWAEEHGIVPDDPRVKQKADRIYEYEIKHLPQAAIWTVSSIGLNVGTQKILPVLSRGKLENSADIGSLLLFKTIGAAISAGLVFTARSSSPRLAHKWDRWIGENLFEPAERNVNALLGLNARAPTWQERVAQDVPQEDRTPMQGR